MTWSVEVIEEGRFDVELYYTCPQDSLGSELELNLGEQTLVATITEPNNPDPQGRQHDRVPRKTQSPMKDFRPLKMGTIIADRGQCELELRARRIVGDGPIEARLLLFRRIP